MGNLLVLAGFLTVGLSGSGVLAKLGAMVVLAFLVLISDASPQGFLRSLRFVILFAAVLFVAQALSIRDGRTIVRIGISITDRGALAGAQMALRFLLILSSSFLFVTVTDPDRLAHLFVRLGVPYRYGYVLILALRFVPFFRDELRTVRTAQQLRGIRTSVRSPAGIRRAVRYTFLPVLASGLMRVDSIAMSMKGRCFGLHPRRTAAPLERMTWADGLAALAGGLLIVGGILAGRFTWP
jgi:energy-coupling factor transport system permease protein